MLIHTRFLLSSSSPEDTAFQVAAQRDRTGQDRKGEERTGPDRPTGKDRRGQERRVEESRAEERRGEDQTGQDRRGQESVSDRNWSAAPRIVRPRCWLHSLFACPQVGKDCAQDRAPSLGSFDCVSSPCCSEPLLDVTSYEHFRWFSSHFRMILPRFLWSSSLMVSEPAKCELAVSMT